MNNFNKQIIIAVALLLSIAGISFAAVLGDYGSIVGTANVSPPEFYIGTAKENNETLLINEKSPNCGHFHIQDDFTRIFITEKNLGGMDFNYIPKAEFSIRAKMNATTTPQDLTLKFGYINMNDVVTTICSTDISLINKMKNYTMKFIDCLEKPRNVKYFYYEMSGNCDDCKYTIGKCAGGFYTKVKFDK